MSRPIFALLSTAFALTLLTLPNASMAGPGGPDAPPAIYDFNDDGRSDILLNKAGAASNNGLLRTMLLEGTALGANGLSFVKLLDPDQYDTIGAGNFSGTGQADILTRRVSGVNVGLLRILTLNAEGTVAVDNVFPAAVNPQYEFFGIGDFDGNGVDDIGLVKTDGVQNLGLIRIYLFNDGNEGSPGDRMPMGGSPISVAFVPQNYKAIGLEDVNGDGLADVVMIKETSPVGLVRAFPANEDQTIGSSIFPTATPENYELAAIGRFDPGLTVDYFFLKTVDPIGLVRLILSDTAENNGNAFPAILPAGHVLAALGDFDGVNQSDFATRSVANGAIRISLMTAAGTEVSTADFPAAPSTDFKVINNAPVELTVP